MPTISVMIIIMITWLLTQAVFVGIGYLVTQKFLKDTISYHNYFLNAWVGRAFTLIFLQVWIFFFPVNDLSRLLLISIGLVGYGLCLRQYTPLLKRNKRVFFAVFFLLILTLLWLANQSLAYNGHYDAALYHLQAIRWFSEYPIIPGLGNLHDRLAFSNGYFLYPALFNTGFWLNRFSHVANALLYWMGFCYIASLVLKSESVKGYLIARSVMLLLLLTMIYTMENNVANVSNDVPIILLGYLIAVLVWNYLFIVHDANTQDSLLPRMLMIILLSSIGVMIKFNFIVIGGLSSILVVLLWLWQKRDNYSVALAGFGISVVIALMVFVPMGIRSVIHTGYILYPITFSGEFDVAWKMPAERGQDTVIAVAVWARQPGIIDDPSVRAKLFSNYDWFPEWFNRHKNNKIHILIPLALTFISLIGIIIMMIWHVIALIAIKYNQDTYLRKLPLPIHSGNLRLLWIYWFIIIASIVFWFFSAPDPRFLGSLLYVAALSTFGILLIYLPRLLRQAVQMIVLIIFVYLTVQLVKLRPIYQLQSFDELDYQEYGTEVQKTVSGLEIYTPETRDLCGNAILPCTPYFNEDIRLITLGDLASGFIVED